jgi:hypothetical protein
MSKAFVDGCGKGLASSVIFTISMVMVFVVYYFTKQYLIREGAVGDLQKSVFAFLVALGTWNIWMMSDLMVERNFDRYERREAEARKNLEG